MPKPKSKKELIAQSESNYNSLIELINSYSKEKLQKEFSDNRMNRNVRDVIAHLHHWHLLFLNWYKIGMKGEKPKMPADGFTWKTVPELNLKIWKMYQKTSLKSILEKFETSHKKIQKIIEKHNNEELFVKKKYNWTGSTSLGAYLISNTSSHYAWAIKRIKQSLK